MKTAVELFLEIFPDAKPSDSDAFYPISFDEFERAIDTARTEQMQINWDKIELECRKAGLIIELKSYQGDVNLNNDTRGTQYVAMRGIIDLIKKELRPKP